MKQFIQAAQQFAKDEEGVTAIEYGLIAALIAVAIIVAVTAVGGNLNFDLHLHLGPAEDP